MMYEVEGVPGAEILRRLSHNSRKQRQHNKARR